MSVADRERKKPNARPRTTTSIIECSSLLRVVRSEQLSRHFGRQFWDRSTANRLANPVPRPHFFGQCCHYAHMFSRSSRQQRYRNFIVAARCSISRCGVPIRYGTRLASNSATCLAAHSPLRFPRFESTALPEFMFHAAHAPMKLVYARLAIRAATSLWLVCSSANELSPKC